MVVVVGSFQAETLVGLIRPFRSPFTLPLDALWAPSYPAPTSPTLTLCSKLQSELAAFTGLNEVTLEHLYMWFTWLSYRAS